MSAHKIRCGTCATSTIEVETWTRMNPHPKGRTLDLGPASCDSTGAAFCPVCEEHGGALLFTDREEDRDRAREILFERRDEKRAERAAFKAAI